MEFSDVIDVSSNSLRLTFRCYAFVSGYGVLSQIARILRILAAEFSIAVVVRPLLLLWS